MATTKGRGTASAPAALAEYRRKRDFKKTAEPSGGGARPAARLRFVVQKHAASRLHFDFRLELDGVMKSWAVPKGPSLDPAVRRLAMQVEDHPIEYNTFEGTIPQGEYGGGTVMLWDRGTYRSAEQERGDETDEDLLRRGYERGDLKFELHGDRLRGSWVLVRTRGMGGSDSKPSWLLIKHRDQYALPASDIAATVSTSVTTGRTMDEIAKGRRQWHSNRGRDGAVGRAAPATPRADGSAADGPASAASKRRTAGRATPASRAAGRKSTGRSPARAPAPRRAGSPSRGRAAEPPRPSFALTHPDKVVFPRDGYTKGDLARYYETVAPHLLPLLKDRPLALKRYPDGIGRPFFFQQKAPPRDQAPRGVRIEPVPVESEGGPRPRLIGGSLATLLYTVQIGCIAVDPWHARIRSLDRPDYAIVDLDPGEGVPFRRVVDVARWTRDVLDEWGLVGAPKTSGSRGIHIYLPLPAKASDAVAVGLAQHIAARVAALHPRQATVERDIDRRPRGSVYVDFLQNARGKTVTAAYAVRAVDGARVSMPLGWDELTAGLDPRAFTIASAPERIAAMGDIWGPAMRRRNSAPAVRRLLD